MFPVEWTPSTYIFATMKYWGSRLSKEYCILYSLSLGMCDTAPFPMQVPLAPCLSQGTVAKAIFSSCKGNWNCLPLWEFLSPCCLNVGCIAGGAGGLFLVLAFAFNLWECLMEAQHGTTKCKAKLCLLEYDCERGRDMCSRSILALRDTTQNILLSFYSEKVQTRHKWQGKSSRYLAHTVCDKVLRGCSALSIRNCH